MSGAMPVTGRRPGAGSGPRAWYLAGWALLATSALWPIWRFVIVYPGQVWQLDLEVYRDGARNLLGGVPVYDWLTGAPQFLPFTYPPFSALLMAPLALVPFTAAGWAWTLLQVALVWVCAGVAFAPLIERFAQRAPLVQGAVAAVLIQLYPVSDGIRYGQMNAVIVTLCLLDARPRAAARRLGRLARPVGRLPRGVLTGLAAAIKLTPALFWLHFAVSRRWATLAVSLAAGAGATLLAFAADPSSSAVFWSDAISDPARLGPNSGVSNQSIRGVLLRWGPPNPTLSSLLWLALVALVLWFGLRTASRFEARGERVGVVATVGMVIVLVSPVSWIHHWHWSIAVLGVLCGDGLDRSRRLWTLGLGVFLLFGLPYSAGAWPGALLALGVLAQNSYCLEALLSLVLLARLTSPARAER